MQTLQKYQILEVTHSGLNAELHTLGRPLIYKYNNNHYHWYDQHVTI
jgi:hypothetical protein